MFLDGRAHLRLPFSNQVSAGISAVIGALYSGEDKFVADGINDDGRFCNDSGAWRGASHLLRCLANAVDALSLINAAGILSSERLKTR
jgi:hypothetical protein